MVSKELVKTLLNTMQPKWGKFFKRYTYTESPWCILETVTTLLINYSLM